MNIIHYSSFAVSLTLCLTAFYFIIVNCKTIQDEIDTVEESFLEHCQCINYDCGCCSKIYIKNVLDGKLCSNFSYLPDQYGISVTITYNDVSLVNETISAKNPPPICILHFDQLQMEFCVRLYNLDIKKKCFSGCVELEIHFFGVIPLKHFNLGCFSCNSTTSALSVVRQTKNNASTGKNLITDPTFYKILFKKIFNI